MGGVVGGITVLALAACFILLFLKKRRRAGQQKADKMNDGYQTTSKHKTTSLQEMDHDSERPFELGENALCEVELGQISEMESGGMQQYHRKPVELG